MNFEESIKKLEEIAEKLENGNCSLDESIDLYEQATKISKSCSEILNNAKLKISKIDDAFKVEEFDE